MVSNRADTGKVLGQWLYFHSPSSKPGHYKTDISYINVSYMYVRYLTYVCRHCFHKIYQPWTRFNITYHTKILPEFINRHRARSFIKRILYSTIFDVSRYVVFDACLMLPCLIFLCLMFPALIFPAVITPQLGSWCQPYRNEKIACDRDQEISGSALQCL